MPEQSWKGERGTPAERGYDSKWVKLRNNYIKHNPLCEARGPACKGAARIVHHVVPVRVRPDLRLARENLQSVCDPCHRMLHEERVPGVVVAVCGAPASGKTTHVEASRKAGDCVWDWDHIRTAINFPSACTSNEQWLLSDWRSTFIQRIKSGYIPRTLWLVVGSVRTAAQVGDQYVCMARGEDDCKRSILDRFGRREDRPSANRMIEAVSRWFNMYASHVGTSGTCESLRKILPPPVRPDGGTQLTTAQKTLFRAQNEEPNGLEKHSADILQRIARAETASWRSDPGERG